MSDYAPQLAAVVAVAERHQDLPHLEERRCRRCGRVNARVVDVNGHRLYVTYVLKARDTRRTVDLYRLARVSGGRASRSAPRQVQLFYALLDHPNCPELPKRWCPHGHDVQLESPTLC